MKLWNWLFGEPKKEPEEPYIQPYVKPELSTFNIGGVKITTEERGSNIYVNAEGNPVDSKYVKDLIGDLLKQNCKFFYRRVEQDGDFYGHTSVVQKIGEELKLLTYDTINKVCRGLERDIQNSIALDAFRDYFNETIRDSVRGLFERAAEPFLNAVVKTLKDGGRPLTETEEAGVRDALMKVIHKQKTKEY